MSAPGDVLELTDERGTPRAYRIASLNESAVRLVWEVEEGDAVTLYPYLPGQSVAVRVTDAQVTFRTTPADPEAPLTVHAFWPNATRVRSLNDTHVVFEHHPAVGLEFVLQSRTSQAAATVAGHTERHVLLDVENDHPLAGQTVVFDVVVRAAHTTGVEMDALTGCAVALLTVWDMVKALEKDARGQYPHAALRDLRVVRKEKGP